MEFMDYIRPELLCIVPVVYLIGMGLKKSKLPDKWIPLILGGISILICALWVCATSDINNIRNITLAMFTSITQGILAAGASVYINQLYKQSKKKN